MAAGAHPPQRAAVCTQVSTGAACAAETPGLAEAASRLSQTVGQSEMNVPLCITDGSCRVQDRLYSHENACIFGAGMLVATSCSLRLQLPQSHKTREQSPLARRRASILICAKST